MLELILDLDQLADDLTRLKDLLDVECFAFSTP